MVCVGVRVRRCKTGLSHRVSLEVLSGGGSGVCRSKRGLSQRVSFELSLARVSTGG